jgi:outer membrane murein-binding lipoprotein Lpp
MHRITPAFALVLCTCLLAGCASSHKKALQPVMIGAEGARFAQLAEVKAARASDHVFAIFPSAPDQRKCRIPASGGVHTVKLVFRGVGRTSVRPGAPAVVVFTERWHSGPPCKAGTECVPGGWPLRRHSWLLTMGPLAMQTGGHRYQKPPVKSSRERGNQPPQGPRP